jgi:catechol 2,3-dioxygenase-like lactoylglutathione lyase family enzyme
MLCVRATAGGSNVANTPQLRVATVCIDCADAGAMADFYGRLLGWDVTRRESGWVLMRNPSGGTGLSFQAEAASRAPVWPEEPGGQDKMLHLDIKVDDLDSAVAHALASGARLAEYQPQERVRVLLDPSGHPLCLFLD